MQSLRTLRYALFAVGLGLMVLVGACGGGAAPAPAATSAPAVETESEAAPVASGPSAEQGKAIFTSAVIGAGTNGCGNCHYVKASQGDLAGPNLSGIGERAATRVPGLTAEEYIRQSIVDPTAYEVEGWSAAAMPANYGAEMSEEEIESLVLYLMTLKD
ncbi:MAG: cytochrome c [Chloroflexaceae bacterium]|nr:cytochrome c [Chloroflexaceae bacterium]